MVSYSGMQLCFCFTCQPRNFWFSCNMYRDSEAILTEWKISNEKYDTMFTDNGTHMMKVRNHKFTLFGCVFKNYNTM